MTSCLKSILFFIFLLSSYCLPKENNEFLTQKEAIERKQLIGLINYEIDLDITDRKVYFGKVIIHFNLLKKTKFPLRIDFLDGNVTSIQANGKNHEWISKSKNNIYLEPEYLKEGSNFVVIEYNHEYSKSGEGLHQYLDTSDDHYYIYSQFEDFHANKMFPCFDQPDLKARYYLSVKGPRNWKYISASPIKSEEITESHKFVQFQNSEIFSPYVFSLHAGPFSSFDSNDLLYKSTLYVRKSQEEFTEPEYWFEQTSKAIAFYENYFGIKYPFKKIDHLIVPEFNFGAMENVGAIAYSEKFLSRRKNSLEHRRYISSVIFHELAHMWFGNLITIEWWDNLWLNESFATYMSTLAEAKILNEDRAWIAFNQQMKRWAYSEDNDPNNHPISGTVESTEESFSQFDGITYGKGASVLNQLSYFIGKDNFQNGIQNLIHKHQFGNINLNDFVNALSLDGKFPIESWSKEWIYAKGFNLFEIQNLEHEIVFFQKKTKFTDNIKNHSLDMIIFYEDGSIKEQKIQLYAGKTVFPKNKAITLIFPNYDDFDHALYFLDPSLIQNIPKVYEKIESKRNRYYLITMLYYSFLYNKIPAKEFVLILYELESKEKDNFIQREIYRILASKANKSLYSLWYRESIPYKSEKFRKISQFFLQKSYERTNNEDLKIELFQSYISFTRDKQELEKIYKFLKDDSIFSHIKKDQRLIWHILHVLMDKNFRPQDLMEYAEGIIEKNKNSYNIENFEGLKASYPDLDNKNYYLSLIQSSNSDSSDHRKKLWLNQLFPKEQLYLEIETREQRLKILNEYLQKSSGFSELVFSELTRSDCSYDSIEELDTIKKNNTLSKVLLKKLSSKQYSIENCMEFLDYHL
jgi:aminopeptidase N